VPDEFNPQVVIEAKIAEDEIDDALERTNTIGHMAVGTRRFVSGFWNAFRVPLEDGRTRFVGLKTPIRFQDLGSEEPPPRDFKEIRPDDILGLDGSIEQIRKKISEWLERNKLSETEFLVKSRREDARLPADDLLGRLIVALEPDELRRMSIPMDIVGKLRRKPN